MDNRPVELGELTAFKENDAPIQVEFESVDLIGSPLVVEVWSNDVFLQNVASSAVDKTIITTLPKELLRVVNARNSNVYIKFGVEYKYSISLKTTLDGSVSQPRLKYVTAPSVGTIRVSTYSDFVSVQEAQAAAISAAASAAEAQAAAQTAANRYVEMGPWNAATNSPTLSSTAPGPDGNGKYQRYVINTPGTLLISINGMAAGTYINYGELIAGPGNQWFYNPADSTALSVIETEIKPNLPGTTERTDFPIPILLDSLSKALLMAEEDGSISGTFNLQDGAVLPNALSEDTLDLMPGSLDPTHYPLIPIVVSDDNKMVLYFDPSDERVKGPISVEGGAISYGSLDEDLQGRVMTDDFKRITQPNPHDTDTEDDDLWRANLVDCPAKTESTGYGYAKFPPVRTRVLRGVNNTGTSLTFTKMPIPVHGKRYKSDLNASTPTLSGPFLAGDFGRVTQDGTYHGVVAKAGQYVLVVGNYSASQFSLSKTGEYYLMGEMTPSSFSPVSPFIGDMYIALASGTFSGIALVAGDVVVYDGGWSKANSELQTIASGNGFTLPCGSAADWAVRRADKSTTVVTVPAKIQRATVRRRAASEYVFWGDSMPGTLNMAQALFTAMGVVGTQKSFGGATSDQVASQIKQEIRSTDLYVGRTHLFWHQHNNYLDVAQTQRAAYEMASLVGSYDKRFCFWTMAGSRSMTYNGTRLVSSIYEDAFAGTGSVWEMEQFYQKAFPRNYHNVRLALLASAVGRTTPDPQFPGMTEAQVASTYGIVPLSYLLSYPALPFTAEQLDFVNYLSTGVGLPAGTGLYQYYILTFTAASGSVPSGNIGDLLVWYSSAWHRITPDPLHFVAEEGKQALITAFQAFNATAQF